MFCSKCGIESGESQKFCRKCGTDLDTSLAGVMHPDSLEAASVRARLVNVGSKDPDELTGNGIGSVIMGDGFLMVAVFLGVTQTSVSSLLWLLLLIPAFFFFGKGFADVLHARQIRRRLKQAELDTQSPYAELQGPFEGLRDRTSQRLIPSSVTERTTRHLE